jgi:hypothetical protein
LIFDYRITSREATLRGAASRQIFSREVFRTDQLPTEGASPTELDRRDELFQSLELIMRCPVCYETITDAVLDAQGVTYCRVCLLTAIERSGRAPISNLAISAHEIRPNLLINEMLQRIFSSARL